VRLHVFVGPSLPSRARPSGTQIYHPPIQHGDLFRLDLRPGDRVLIIDGVYQHAAPIRHKEIMAMLRRKVRVYGAASMGALRASELHLFGMRGLGRVFGAYRSGLLESDADVAVLHADADADYQAFTIAHVSVAMAARSLHRAGMISALDADQVTSVSASLHFTERTPAAFLSRADGAGMRAAASRVLAEVTDGGDVKRTDALAAIERLLSAVAATPDEVAQETAECPGTISSYETEWWLEKSAWHGLSGLTRAEVLTFLQLILDDYPRRHLSYVRRVVGDTLAMPGADSEQLLTSAGLWPADARLRRELLAGMMSARETFPDGPGAADLVLVRTFRLAPGRLLYLDVPPEACIGLNMEEMESACSRLLSVADAVERHRPGSVDRLSPQLVDGELVTAWRLPDAAELELAAVDRGFRGLDEARRRCARFVPGLRALRASGAP